MVKDEHDGAKLLRIITGHGFKVADLGKAGGKSWTAGKDWTKAETIGPEMRLSVIAALNELGIDPRLMWPDATSASLAELKTLLSGTEPDVLYKIRRVLEAKGADQIRLIDWIEGKLDDIRHKKP